jgi:hypothetical protein
LAASSATLARHLAPNAIAKNGVLRACLVAIGPRYIFTLRGDTEVIHPKDLSARHFVPEGSPLPSTIPRGAALTVANIWPTLRRATTWRSSSNAAAAGTRLDAAFPEQV